MSVNTAKERAEEVLHTVQKRARDLLDAEDGLVKAVRELVENKGLSAGEVRRRLEDLMGRVKARKVWERLKTSDTVVVLSDYRDEFERRAEERFQRFLGTLQIASKADMETLSRQVRSLSKKINDLAKKLDSGESAK